MNKIVIWLMQHNLMLFAMLIALAIFFWAMRFEKKMAMTWKSALFVAMAHVALGWSAMRLLAYIEVGFNFERAANMRIFGAVFLLPPLYYLWARYTHRKPLLVSDFSAISTIMGCISGRLNCLTGTCCRGVPILAEGTFRWPIRELELLFYIVFIALYSKKIQKGKTRGEVYPIYMIAYGTLRFFCEFAREEFTTKVGFFHLAHIWALMSIIAGAVWLYLLKRKQARFRKKPGKNHRIRRENI